MLYGILPFDPVVEVLFFILLLFMLVPIFVLLITNIIRKKRFGYVFPPKLLGLKMNPSQTFKMIELVATKDTVETKHQEEIFHAHERSIYAGDGGTKLCVIIPISDFAQNARLVNYVLKLKDGKNKAGKNGETVRFSSLNEARLYFYENIFLPKDQENGPDWNKQEMKKVKQAKGLIMGIREITEDQIQTSPDGTTTQLRRKEEIPTGPMTASQFDDFMISIQERAIQYPVDIFAITIDGETLSFNALEKWMASPSPENTLDEQFMRGYRKGQRDSSRQASDILKYAMAFMIIAVAAAFLFSKL